MLVIHATFPIDPDQSDEALERIRELAEQSRQEEGVISYRPTRDVDNENVFRFFEQYEDEAAFEAHAETDHFQKFESALPDLLDGEPEVTRFDVESSADVPL